MRFSLATAALATLAVGVAASEEEYSTVVVTDYTTYCPKATSSLAEGGAPPASAITSITVSGGTSYSVTRPLITSTVTSCKKCTKTKTQTPAVQTPSGDSPNGGSPGTNSPSGDSPVAPTTNIPIVVPTTTAPAATSTPLASTSAPPSPPAAVASSSSGVIPSGAAPSGSASGSATTPASPVFTGGASRAAAGAGAGLATVFGLVAYLL